MVYIILEVSCVSVIEMRERQGQRERQRERQRETDRDREVNVFEL